jgi:hypothetical protein
VRHKVVGRLGRFVRGMSMRFGAQASFLVSVDSCCESTACRLGAPNKPEFLRGCAIFITVDFETTGAHGDQ